MPSSSGARLGELLWAVPGRFRPSPGPLGAQIAALPRTKSTVETKFDLTLPFRQALGSLHGFFGFLGGHGVSSRFYLGNDFFDHGFG